MEYARFSAEVWCDKCFENLYSALDATAERLNYIEFGSCKLIVGRFAVTDGADTAGAELWWELPIDYQYPCHENTVVVIHGDNVDLVKFTPHDVFDVRLENLQPEALVGGA